ncbi:MAG: ABC transporter ATP-binding protein [Anaerolineae bacterium]|jgi:branched-chain amino acid transport system ATP-binding protein|nr:ABC transporter ATP-binding protein [Anaerolineae bacterium]
MTILEARGLRKEFGGLVAVDEVNLTIQRGTTHAIIGPNGAGKTTFFNLLTGKYKPTRGTVIYKGQDITQLPVYRRSHLGIGRSFQITNIFPNLTLLENVRLASQALSGDNFRFLQRTSLLKKHLDRAVQVLAIVGLTDVYAFANTLPHGGKRKLELAILLAADPELLLLDEPTAGMASEQVPELIETIRKIQREGNKTVVLVEHNMNVVMNISDQITVMHLGRVLAEGTPSAIASDKTVQSVYLGELYDLPGKS